MITPLLIATGVGGPVLFMLATLYIGSVRPHYSPIRTFMSQLCLNGGACWQIATFILSGTLIAIFGSLLQTEHLDPSVPPWGWWAVLGSGIGFIGIGIHRDDPWLSYPPGAPEGLGFPVSAHGLAHVLMSGFTGLALAVSIASFSAQWDGCWPIYSALSMAAFLGFYVIALVSGYFSGRRRRFGGFAGLFQRLSVFTALVWIAVLAGRVVAARLA
jgi:hypothetical protein